MPVLHIKVWLQIFGITHRQLIMVSRGRLGAKKRSLTLCKLLRKWPTFNLIYHTSKQFPDDFIVSITNFKSSSVQHEEQNVNVPVGQFAIQTFVTHRHTLYINYINKIHITCTITIDHPDYSLFKMPIARVKDNLCLFMLPLGKLNLRPNGSIWNSKCKGRRGSI